jgi:hypothetical protein
MSLTASEGSGNFRIKVLFLVPELANFSLINSLIDELPALGVAVSVESYLPNTSYFWGKPAINFDRLEGTSFDAVIALDFGYLNGKKVKALFPQSRLVLFAGDTPQSLPSQTYMYSLGILIKKFLSQNKSPYIRRFGLCKSAPYYDTVLASDPRAVLEFEKIGVEAHWFPYWCEQISKYQNNVSPKDINFDLVTVMTPRPDRRDMLRYLSDSEEISFHSGYGLQQSEIQDLYSTGLAVLNRSSYGEMTIRFFEAYAAGRVVVTNELSPDSGLDELFIENRHYYTFTDLEHLTEIMIDLKKEASRVYEFGLEANELARKHHLPIHRAQQLVKVVESIL